MNSIEQHNTGTSSTLAIFEVTVTAIDKPHDRRRWNGGPIASTEANRVLDKAVATFRAVIEAEGFVVAHTSYGVAARESVA